MANAVENVGVIHSAKLVSDPDPTSAKSAVGFPTNAFRVSSGLGGPHVRFESQALVNEEWLSFDSHFISDPAGIRTQGPYIKSVMLYQLSYGIKPALPSKRGCKDTILLELPK